MAVTLDATAAGASSNTYATLAQSETYHEKRLHNAVWDDTTDGNKNIALVWATRLLDEQFVWMGDRYDDDQALDWPRDDVYDKYGDEVDESTIPQFLINATAELALALIKSDTTAVVDNGGLDSFKIRGTNLKFSKSATPKVIPDSVFELLEPYCENKRGQVFLKRV